MDYEKAFDGVDCAKMLDILKDFGIEKRDRRLICELYMKQDAVIRVKDADKHPCSKGRGVRQGCTLTPLMFNLCIEDDNKDCMTSMKEWMLEENY